MVWPRRCKPIEAKAGQISSVMHCVLANQILCFSQIPIPRAQKQRCFSVVVPFIRLNNNTTYCQQFCCVYVSVRLTTPSYLSFRVLRISMPSTKSYCQGGLWLKKGENDGMESVIADFRDLLQVNHKEADDMSYDPLFVDCERPQTDDTEITLRACICPTADPFRKSTSSSSSYGLLMELIEQGNLIKEAVRRLKTSPSRSKQLKRLDRCR